MSTTSIHIISLNILGSHSSAPHEWERRRPLLATMWNRLAPDIVGIQEGRAHQIADMKSLLPEYEHFGLSRSHPRDDGDEQSAIWIRRERFSVLDCGYFWLSNAPDVPGSQSWGAAFPRMVTWMKLQERGGARLAVFNTHFDHISEEARRLGALVLRERWHEMARAEPEIAIVVMGDFNSLAPLSNSSAKDEAYRILTAPDGNGPGLRDTLLQSPKRGESRGTFHGFFGKATERIDWILCNDAPQLESADVLDGEPESREISDHFGVEAKFSLPNDSHKK